MNLFNFFFQPELNPYQQPLAQPMAPTPSQPISSPTPSQPTLTPPSLALSILPHALLPLLLFAVYLPPPSRLRAPVFLAALAVLQWRCVVSPWPPNGSPADAGPGFDRALRYGLACSWIFVLPVLQRIVVQTPERDFWRVDDTAGGRPAPPREWSVEKLRWAMNLVATPRGVGWNFGGRGVNARREVMRREGVVKPEGRGRYVVRALGRAARCWVVWDGLILATQKATGEGRVPRRWAWEGKTLGDVAFAELMMLGIPWFGMMMQFEMGRAVGVGLGLNKPEDWPELFGDLVECWTVANVWGGFWHQYLRQPCLGFSRRINEVLGIPKRSPVAYFVHLVTAFTIAAFFHVLSLAPLSPGWYPFGTLVSDMCIFFLLQPIGTMFELGVMTLFARYVWKPEPVGEEAKPLVQATDSPTAGALPSPSLGVMGKMQKFGRTNKDVMIRAACRLVGYVWVILWFWVTSWWFVKPYLGVGMAGWQFSFSFLAWLLIPGRSK
ncbi:hypothetical protein QBC39DRAFT_44039 [Podospora conica]|nr:hypothetical protein QBC39DRAFT_44039 [Schizothecium conicum]